MASLFDEIGPVPQSATPESQLNAAMNGGATGRGGIVGIFDNPYVAFGLSMLSGGDVDQALQSMRSAQEMRSKLAYYNQLQQAKKQELAQAQREAQLKDYQGRLAYLLASETDPARRQQLEALRAQAAVQSSGNMSDAYGEADEVVERPIDDDTVGIFRVNRYTGEETPMGMMSSKFSQSKMLQEDRQAFSAQQQEDRQSHAYGLAAYNDKLIRARNAEGGTKLSEGDTNFIKLINQTQGVEVLRIPDSYAKTDAQRDILRRAKAQATYSDPEQYRNMIATGMIQDEDYLTKSANAGIEAFNKRSEADATKVRPASINDIPGQEPVVTKGPYVKLDPISVKGTETPGPNRVVGAQPQVEVVPARRAAPIQGRPITPQGASPSSVVAPQQADTGMLSWPERIEQSIMNWYGITPGSQDVSGANEAAARRRKKKEEEERRRRQQQRANQQKTTPGAQQQLFNEINIR